MSFIKQQFKKIKKIRYLETREDEIDWEKEKRNIAILLITAVFISIFIIPRGHDMWFHLYRIGSIADNLRWKGLAGFPYRIYVTSFHSYGYGAPLFYGDLFLYLPAFLVCAGISEWTAYRIFMAGIILAAFTAMYYSVQLLRIGEDNEEYQKFAMAAAFFYVFSPGFIENIWIRAAIGEAVSSVFLPVVFCMVYKITMQADWKLPHAFLLGIGISGLVLSHVIMTIIAGLTVLAFVIFHWKRLAADLKRAGGLVLGAVISICLTAYWCFPFIEQYVVMKPETNSSVETYVNNGIRFWCWFLPFILYEIRHYLYGGALNVKWLPSCVGWGFFVMIYAMCRYYRKIRNHKVFYYGFASFLMLLLITIRPWNRMLGEKFLAFKLQFPWRILMLVYFLLALALAYLVLCINQKKILKLFRKTMLISSIVPASLILLSGIGVIIMGENPYSSIQTYHSKGDALYLPSGTDGEEICKQEGSVSANREITFSVRRETGKIQVLVKENSYQNTVLNIPFLYYKGYYAENIDTGKQYAIKKSEQGYLDINIGNDSGDIEIYYKGTMTQKISNGISAVSCISVMICLCIYIKGRRKKT